MAGVADQLCEEIKGLSDTEIWIDSISLGTVAYYIVELGRFKPTPRHSESSHAYLTAGKGLITHQTLKCGGLTGAIDS